tara:strand:- start:3766 stop:4092 length:327 start_codon:yes stop_codon:yes gene_type:complete
MMKRANIKRKTPLKRGTKPLKRTPLSPISKNPRAVAKRRLYEKNKKEYLMGHPNCEKCGKTGERDLHHKAGRSGTNYTDKETFMAACRACHDWIHQNPKEARAGGYLV